jgi:transcriptional regulator with XRE-family HTH domain
MDSHARTIYRSAIGDRLAMARKSTGLNQQDLADAVGLSKSVISNWERGLNSPPADDLGRIAQVLRCSAEWLVGVPGGEDRVCLIDTQAEAILLASDRVDREFRYRQLRLGTVAHVASQRVSTPEELGERIAAVERHRIKLEGEEHEPPSGRGLRGRVR